MKNPLLNDMINACAKISTASHQMVMLTESVAMAIAAAIKVTLCHRCGQLSHFKSQCPHKALSSGVINNKKLAPETILCNRCGKPGYYAKQCKFCFHVNGQHLKDQGNCSL